MLEYVSAITSKGQTTIPKAVRQALGVYPHDKIVFIVDDDNPAGPGARVSLEAKNRNINDLAGIFSRPENQPVSVAAMNESLRRRAMDNI